MKKVVVHICRPRRGRYSLPIPIRQVKIKWVNDEEKEVKAPKILKCELNDLFHPKKRRYEYSKMFYLRWILTKRELKEAVDEFDIFSIDVPALIICPRCAYQIFDETEKKVKNREGIVVCKICLEELIFDKKRKCYVHQNKSVYKKTDRHKVLPVFLKFDELKEEKQLKLENDKV